MKARFPRNNPCLHHLGLGKPGFCRTFQGRGEGLRTHKLPGLLSIYKKNPSLSRDTDLPHRHPQQPPRWSLIEVGAILEACSFSREFGQLQPLLLPWFPFPGQTRKKKKAQHSRNQVRKAIPSVFAKKGNSFVCFSCWAFPLPASPPQVASFPQGTGMRGYRLETHVPETHLSLTYSVSIATTPHGLSSNFSVSWNMKTLLCLRPSWKQKKMSF